MTKRARIPAHLSPRERVELLEALRQELDNIEYEATKLVRGTPEEGRAEGYWLGQLRDILGNGSISLQSTIDELRRDLEAR